MADTPSPTPADAKSAEPTPTPSPVAPGAKPHASEETTAPTPAGDQKLGEGGIKALNAERERREKAERDLAALRKEIDDAKKTAEQRAADDLKAAQAEAATNAARALRYEVAAEAGIPLSLASRLTGTTREEIAKDAEAFKQLIPVGATPARNPAPDPSQGPRGVPEKTDADKAYEAVYGSH